MDRIRFVITRNKDINLEQIIGVFLLAIPFLNLWSFFGYYAKLYSVGLTLLVLFLIKVFDRSSWNKFPLISLLFLAYMTVHMLFINFSASFSYYIIIITGCLMTQLKLSKSTIKLMESIMVSVGIFYAVTLIWHWASPNSFYPVLKLFVLEGNYQQAIESVKISGNFTGFACESHRACVCIAPAASILFSKIFFKRDKHILWSIILFCIAYFAMVLSERRAFILFFPTVIVGASLYFMFRRRSRNAKLWSIALTLLLFFVFYFFLFDRVMAILSRGSGTTIALSNREVYWNLAISLYQKHPVIGNGMRSYDYYYNIMSGRNIVFAGAHNSFLEMLAEIGIIGTVLYSALILWIILKTAAKTLFCIRTNDTDTAQILMSALLVECMLLFAGLSEAVFFAPFSLMLFFLFNNISTNAIAFADSDNKGI